MVLVWFFLIEKIKLVIDYTNNVSDEMTSKKQRNFKIDKKSLNFPVKRGKKKLNSIWR